MIRQHICCLAVAVSFYVLALVSASAASPQVISHQGYLTSAAGVPLDGNHSLTFAIYAASSGGAAIWSETHPAVEVNNGLYSLLLGSITPLTPAVFSAAERYLGIAIDGGAELTPRRQIAAAAYSLRSDWSGNSDSLGGNAPSYFLNWSNLANIPAGFADGVDNVGTGDITGVTAGEGLGGGGTSGTVNLYLDTAGVASKNIADGTITNDDISASAAIALSKITGTAMNLATAQIVTANKTFDGTVYFGDSTMRIDGNGIRIGSALAPSATYMMLLDRHVTTAFSRYGLYVDLDNTSTGSVYGVYGRASSETPGAANSGTVYGIYGTGISDGPERYGARLIGRGRTATNSGGLSYGLDVQATYGMAAYGMNATVSGSTSGYGIFLEVNGNQTGVGLYTSVHDNTASSSSIGSTNIVVSNDGTAYGIAGTVGNNGGTGYAVYGHAYSNSTNWSGYFTGDVNVGGTIFTPAKVTKIDHPLDPENQILMLAGIDSPELLVKTSGNVTTDAAGNAEVVLPAYFAAVASDFRYQLTVIGEFAQAIIGEEISGGHFSIKTDKPNIKVSWEITGERNDSFAKANRMVNESAKPAEQRGQYLHPEAFGLTFERSVDFEAVQALSKTPPKRQTTDSEAGGEN